MFIAMVFVREAVIDWAIYLKLAMPPTTPTVSITTATINSTKVTPDEPNEDRRQMFPIQRRARRRISFIRCDEV